MQVEDLGKTSCTITWKQPEFDGGSPITGYYVERQSAYSPHWLKVNKTPVTSTSLKVKDLVESNDYNFRVVAENEAGVSQASEETGMVMAKAPYDHPGVPGQPNITDLTKDAATLTWAPPKYDGNSPLTNYVVEYRAAGTYIWTVANLKERVLTPLYKVQGLQEGVQYEFRVSAVNKIGQGPFSETAIAAKTCECTFCLYTGTSSFISACI